MIDLHNTVADRLPRGPTSLNLAGTIAPTARSEHPDFGVPHRPLLGEHDADAADAPGD